MDTYQHASDQRQAALMALYGLSPDEAAIAYRLSDPEQVSQILSAMAAEDGPDWATYCRHVARAPLHPRPEMAIAMQHAVMMRFIERTGK